MKLIKQIFSDWKKDIIVGLIVSFVGWLVTLVWSKVEGKTYKETINKVWTFFKTPITLPLFVFALFILVIYLILKIKRTYFDKLKNTRIGDYTFIQLYRILVTEYVYETTQGMSWNREAPPKENLLEQFVMFHSLLSQGVDFNTNIRDGGYVYGILCPKFHVFGLLDKVSEKLDGVDVTAHSYNINENGKKFWAVLNQLSLKNRKNSSQHVHLQ